MNNQTLKKISVRTVGCRLNQYETEKMAADLYPFGFIRAGNGEPADLYIINTCTVTHRADSTCRGMINKIARENPDASVVVAGCYVDGEPEMIAAINGVDAVIKNAEKVEIAKILPERLPKLFEGLTANNDCDTVADFNTYNRAWIKISDGCNQRCAFCILPTVRGPLINRPPEEIIAEINGFIENGFNEVVLTGVHIGHYRWREYEPVLRNMASLCELILDRTSLQKLRISSIEPQTVREKLLDVYKNSGDRICKHFHLPLQSGSSRILKLMNRPYNQGIYMKRVAAVKDAVPNTIMGADVIVGFPGETDEDFNQTLKVCESGLIDYLHIFTYSDREGTVATSATDKVHNQVAKERNTILAELSDRLKTDSHHRQIGSTLDVIAQNKQREGKFYWGVADNYLKVRLPDHYEGGREVVQVKITDANDDYISGDIVNPS